MRTRWLIPVGAALAASLVWSGMREHPLGLTEALAKLTRSPSAPQLSDVPPAPPDWIDLAPPPVSNTPRQRRLRRADATSRGSRFPLMALAVRFEVPIFDTVERPRRVAGLVRRGNALPARALSSSSGCTSDGRKGRWYATPGGYLCDAEHFEVSDTPIALASRQLHADTRRPLPFAYARVLEAGALRYAHLPSAKERAAAEAAAAEGKTLGPLVIERMEGDFFLALDRQATRDGHRYMRTVRGDYVDADILKPMTLSQLSGVALDAAHTLPIAFVYGTDRADVWCERDSAPAVCGVAERFARFHVAAERTIDGVAYVEMPGGDLVKRDDVRIVRAIGEPRAVDEAEHWIHIDLDEQTLVAYDGPRPVYATLISSGKEGHLTPTGLYRTQRKYVTTTMRGRDPNEGIYHVEEVPWTMYYRGGYAVHGAYWHNDFGKVRSHGCTNVAPVDARWLYRWDTLTPPRGWNGISARPGSWIYFTRGTDS